jgi:hypothetical protein
MPRHLKTVEELLETRVEDRPFIWQDVFFANTMNLVAGKSGCGKSHFLMYLAFLMAMGLPGPGGRIANGVVIYVYAEGIGGLPDRLAALCGYYEIDPARLHGRLILLPKRWDVTEEGFASEILEDLEELGVPQIDAIIFDTYQANAFLAFNEDKASDVELMTKALRGVQQLLGCAIILCHHMGHAGERERGSSNIRAPMDQVLLVEKQGDVVTIRGDKARDTADVPPFRMKIVPFERSAVMVEHEGADVGFSANGVKSGDLLPSVRNALATLVEIGMGMPLTNQRWFIVSGLQRTAYYAAKKALLAGGYVLQDGKGFVPTNKADQLLRLAESSSRTVLRTPHSSSSAPPYKGGGANELKTEVRELRNGVRANQRAQGPGLEPYEWPPIEAAS